MSARKQRLMAIKNIIRTEVIRSHDDLRKALMDKGISSTQATLSRDIWQLEIIKRRGNDGCYSYILPEMRRDEPRLPTSLISESVVEFSGNLALIKTRPGYAMGLASEIDDHSPAEILGTIAGDDTILVIPREGFTREQVRKALSKFLKD